MSLKDGQDLRIENSPGRGTLVQIETPFEALSEADPLAGPDSAVESSAAPHIPGTNTGLMGIAGRLPSATLGVDGRYIWDLSPLYSNQAAWESERSYILQRVQTIGQLRGSGKQSASALADELDAIADLRTRAAKMSIYGDLVNSVDSSPLAQTQYDVGTALQTAAEAAVSFPRGHIDDRRASAEDLVQ